VSLAAISFTPHRLGLGERARPVTARLATGLVVVAIVAGAAVASSAAAVDPGKRPQTMMRPSSSTRGFHARMLALWRGIVKDSEPAALPAFFPEAAYIQVKQLPDAAADYRGRLLANFRADLLAAHRLVFGGRGRPVFVGVRVPHEWAWITPGYCANKVGYWHAPGSRLVYRRGGRTFSFGVFSLISWRGAWYVVHLSVWNEPGTVDAPSVGVGAFGPPGGC
jgi:hypothetical protein